MVTEKFGERESPVMMRVRGWVGSGRGLKERFKN
jgi:hypothetical protein